MECAAKTNLPKIALGAWAWGNDGTFGNDLTAESLKTIFDTAMANGLNLWDTAYAYGMGTSEKVLADFLKGLPRESCLVSDKFAPQCADPASPTAMAGSSAIKWISPKPSHGRWVRTVPR